MLPLRPSVRSVVAALGGVAACTRPAERPPSGARTPPTSGAGAHAAAPRDTDRAYEFTTDSLLYTARHHRGTTPSRQYDLTVFARYRNLRRAPVALTRCFPEDRTPLYGVRDAAADTAGGRAAGAAYDLMWGCVGLREHLVVAAGGTREDTLRLVGPTGWTQEGRPIGEVEGTFYLTYHLAPCPPPLTCAADSAHQRSTTFRVVRAPAR
jgi:hypothetical protein